MEHFTGTRKEAMARLEAIARNYGPQHPVNPTRTLLYRTGDGFLQINDGSMRSYGCRFSVAELLYDSVEAKQAAAAAREAEREQRAAQKAAEKAAKRAQRGSRWRR